LLSFTSVYFFESGLFNELQPIQTKKFFRPPFLVPLFSKLTFRIPKPAVRRSPIGRPVVKRLTEKSIAHILFYRKPAREIFVRVAVRRGWSALSATNRRRCWPAVSNTFALSAVLNAIDAHEHPIWTDFADCADLS
jgi:hypothetical protein